MGTGAKGTVMLEIGTTEIAMTRTESAGIGIDLVIGTVLKSEIAGRDETGIEIVIATEMSEIVVIGTVRGIGIETTTGEIGVDETALRSLSTESVANTLVLL